MFSVAHSYPAAVFQASRTAQEIEWYSIFTGGKKKGRMYITMALFFEELHLSFAFTKRYLC